jgi:hypothetical protein
VTLRVVPDDLRADDHPDVIAAEALPHLLACLRGAVELLDEVGQDVDARVVEAHAAELAAGREWPGEPITPPESIFEKPVDPSGGSR